MSEREENMQERVEELGEEIEEVRDDWEAKKEDASVPGAQPDEEDVETERQDIGEPPPGGEG